MLVGTVALVAGCGSGVKRGVVPLPVVNIPGINPANSSPAITTREEVRQRCAWTILVYLDADNDLEAAGITNMNQMEMIGSTRDVHILVQIDRAPGHDSSNGNWTDTRRYLVTRDSNVAVINSLRLDDPPLGELDMGNWRTLRNFVEWGMNESPSDNYCLVIWDHGTGWQFRVMAAPRHKYIASDETSYSAMNVTDIPKALGGHGSSKLAVLAFDACLMQQIEVAYELRDCASYMVGAPSVEPSPGYSYYSWISRVTSSTTPVQLCKILVDEYVAAYPPPHRGISHSAVDLSRIEELAAALDEFAKLLMDSPAYLTSLQSARNSTLNYSTADGSPNRSYLDLAHYASLCASVLGESAQSAYQRLSDAVGAAMVAEGYGPDMSNARGLGIYIPSPGAYNPAYDYLQFAADTAWDDVLVTLARSDDGESLDLAWDEWLISMGD